MITRGDVGRRGQDDTGLPDVDRGLRERATGSTGLRTCVDHTDRCVLTDLDVRGLVVGHRHGRYGLDVAEVRRLQSVDEGHQRVPTDDE